MYSKHYISAFVLWTSFKSTCAYNSNCTRKKLLNVDINWIREILNGQKNQNVNPGRRLKKFFSVRI